MLTVNSSVASKIKNAKYQLFGVIENQSRVIKLHILYKLWHGWNSKRNNSTSLISTNYLQSNIRSNHIHIKQLWGNIKSHQDKDRDGRKLVANKKPTAQINQIKNALIIMTSLQYSKPLRY